MCVHCVYVYVHMYYLLPPSCVQVQSKVNLKYDAWHKEIVGRFGGLLGQNMQDFYTVISKVSKHLWVEETMVHVQYIAVASLLHGILLLEVTNQCD